MNGNSHNDLHDLPEGKEAARQVAKVQRGADDLPEGWVWTTIGEVAQLVRGVSYDKSAVVETAQNGYVPILRATNIQDERLTLDVDLVYVPDRFVKPEQLLQTGDVVICMSSGSKHLVGKAAQLAHEWHGSFGTFCAAARFNREINPKYAGYFFSSPSYRGLIRQKSSGVNINNLRHHDVGEMLFPLAPFPEQHRIVTEIEKQFTRLDAGIAALKRAQANLKRYKAAVLKAACEGKLVEQDASDEPASELLKRILVERRAKWEANLRAKGKDPKKAKYEEPQAPDIDELPASPKGWCWASAEQCTSLITDGEHITPERSDSGVLLLSARNVQDGWLSLENVDYIPASVYEVLSHRLIIEPGDVLLSCSGSVGRSCVAPENLRFALVRSVAVLKPLSQMGRYLSLAIRSPILQSQINEKKTQTAQANIFQNKIRKLVFPLPPLDEQRRIVAEVERRLSVVQELEATLTANLARAERLRQSILKRAFEGKL